MPAPEPEDKKRKGPLTVTKIRNAKPQQGKRYMMGDGRGLWLEVSPKPPHRRFWRYRYKINGTPGLYAAGEYCDVPDGETPEQAEARRAGGRLTLAEARVEREKWRALVVRGIHPVQAKRDAKAAADIIRANTFAAITEEFIAQRGQRWSATYRARFRGFMEANVLPEIGATPIRDVTAHVVLAILRKIEDRNALRVAALIRVFIGQVFRYGMATGKVAGDPTPALRGALQTRDVEHHAPLSKADIPTFFEALATKSRANRQTEIALRLLGYLFTRPSELVDAAWSEFDLDVAEWRIPKERMKMGRPHVVPLSTQAVGLLRELHTITGRGSWLFLNARRPQDHMSHSALNKVIQRMGFGGSREAPGFSAHGFRATASTMLHETGFDTRLIELQLAHQDRNKSRASYDHSARLAERAAMMQAWADMLDALAQPRSNNVVPLKAAAADAAA
jgi:integrase